jgi:uncharacterized protein (TIGR03083 family)
MPEPSRHDVNVLRASHDRLVSLVGGLDGDAMRGPSYCTEWSVAQVCSHLGSGAELGLAWLESAVAHTDPPAIDTFAPVWDKWNARAPEEQVAECLVADEAHVAAFEALDDAQLADAHIKLFGVMDLDGAGLARFRLGEHAMHSWDIAVELDPAARVAPDAVELLVDVAELFVGMVGKPQSEWDLIVRCTEPDRAYRLASHDAMALQPLEPDEPVGSVDGELQLPSESLLRLVYGRLDDAHATGVELVSDRVTLDDLRATFPGL